MAKLAMLHSEKRGIVKVMSAESRARLNEIVAIDPALMHGLPCFRGTRVPVQVLLDDLKSGYTIDDFLAGCPTVSRELVDGYLDPNC